MNRLFQRKETEQEPVKGFVSPEWPRSKLVTRGIVIVTVNDDEKNDKFIIDADSVELEVYNRWGNLLYKQGDYKNTWLSANMEPGLYYFILHVQGEVTCKGWVQVVN